MTETSLKISETPAYWTHAVGAYPGPVAIVRMAQLIDYDDRLYEAARIVYRFLIAYYHKEYGDALLSMRHVSKVMRSRAPEGAVVLSHSAVRRAIIALMETGWVVRTFRGRGKGKTASRYVPTLNVLDLASRGKFPELLHSNEAVEGGNELLHANETVVEKVLHSNEAVGAELLHTNETKNLIPDPTTLDSAGSGNSNVSAPTTPSAFQAPAGGDGFERIWRAYGKLGNKAASRNAFVDIGDPDVEHIVSRAASWAASAKPGRKRMPLEKWLAAEKYDESDRLPAVKDPSPTPANDNNPPVRRAIQHRMEIVEAHTEESVSGVITLKLIFSQVETGERFPRDIHVEHAKSAEQEKGQAEYQQLLKALDMSQSPDDTEELMFIPIIVTISSTDKWTYAATPAIEEAA